ncbi:MAG: metallophosphoesterase [Bacteroidaceae bacterium]|nr:metallophosphoesterase [Bacteroidaceae bacterium]
MRIQYASDLHLEFRENSEYLAANPMKVAGDIFILAGDTHVFRGQSWEKHPFFDWCAENFRETYIIPGNHEYYDGLELTNRFDDYEQLLRPNVRYLNNRSVVIDDVELFFTTLWTKVPQSELAAVQLGLTDCWRIKYNGRPFCSTDYVTLHEICVNWLSKALTESKMSKKVIITHHQPTTRFSDPRFKNSPINSAFSVDMDDFIEQSGADFWIYGHTHYNGGCMLVIGETTMLCNQLGYVRHSEHGTFSEASVIEI